MVVSEIEGLGINADAARAPVDRVRNSRLLSIDLDQLISWCQSAAPLVDEAIEEGVYALRF